MTSTSATVIEKTENEETNDVKFSVNVNHLKPKPPPTNASGSEITIKEFLNFLTTAYQVQENIEGIFKSEGMTDIVDWIKLKENNLVKPREIAVQTSDHTVKNADKRDSKSRFDSGEPENVDIKRKLGEVLNEGLLDSVLPYLMPPGTAGAQRKHIVLKHDKSGLTVNISEEKLPKGRSSETSAMKLTLSSDVEIHVCDEVKNIRKDFTCNQKLLVEQMGYFAEVTAGQRLEDMDISVHCDIGIFEWLMRWVKRDTLSDTEKPQLDVMCAVPVLVSAAFLKMETLLAECLLFCHENMNEILRTSTSLSCLNDAVLSRLVSMYTNSEVEAIKDRKDKIQSRLFCKLIQALCEVEPESLRGHYSTLGRIYQCKYCHQLVSPLIEDTLPCVPCCTSLELDGTVISKHVRDPNWNITDHVGYLHNIFKTWRKVYWRLWGDAHFLYCLTCKRHFPARQIGWCRYHPDAPQFFTLDAQRAPLPVGRYPCCGERAYRFQLLDDFSGCKFQDHHVCTKEARDASILAMLETYRNAVEEEPPELMFPERLTRLVAKDTSNEDDGSLECKETMWWDGVEILPPRPKLGLLSVFDETEEMDPEPEEPPEDEETFSEHDEFSSSSSNSLSSDSARSEECPSSRNAKRKPIKKKKAKKSHCRLWQHNLSARSNQDLQRAYEEVALKDMVSILASRTTPEIVSQPHRHSKSWSRHITPPGGLWVRLEAEWRESNPCNVPKTKTIYTGKLKNRNRLS